VEAEAVRTCHTGVLSTSDMSLRLVLMCTARGSTANAFFFETIALVGNWPGSATAVGFGVQGLGFRCLSWGGVLTECVVFTDSVMPGVPDLVTW
jgi:hypothetical protein